MPSGDKNYLDDNTIKEIVEQRKRLDEIYHRESLQGYSLKARNRLREIIVEVVEALFGSAPADLVERILRHIWP